MSDQLPGTTEPAGRGDDLPGSAPNRRDEETLTLGPAVSGPGPVASGPGPAAADRTAAGPAGPVDAGQGGVVDEPTRRLAGPFAPPRIPDPYRWAPPAAQPGPAPPPQGYPPPARIDPTPTLSYPPLAYPAPSAPRRSGASDAAPPPALGPGAGHPTERLSLGPGAGHPTQPLPPNLGRYATQPFAPPLSPSLTPQPNPAFGSQPGSPFGPQPNPHPNPQFPPPADHGGARGPGAPPRRGRTGGLLVTVALLALVAGAGGGIAADRLLSDSDAVTATGPVLPPVQQQGGSRPAGSVASVARAVQPSVVTILADSADGAATGSGFVLRSDGYILTNNHVVAAVSGSGAITVTFSDGHQSKAKLIGRTADYDLAVLKVSDTGLKALALGDSDAVVVGDLVVAVGAPLGLNGTVTTGIVSALHRPVQAGSSADAAFIDAIQTDAAMNPGNSGGPLVNGSGQVIGVNSAIAQAPGTGAATGSIGLGFAIPSNQARRTAEQLIKTGKATYPVIGVLLDSTYRGEGVRVAADGARGTEPVTPDGPADTAGIKSGDVILAIDGRPVTHSDELIVAIRAKAPGDTVTLKVRSGGSTKDVRVVLDEVTSE